MVCSSTRSQLGYGKLASRSHYAVGFSVTQQSRAKSITYRRITCASAKENVSVSFKIRGLEFSLQKNSRPSQCESGGVGRIVFSGLTFTIGLFLPTWGLG